MKWEKKGLICSCETFDLPWYKKNTMVPTPYLLNDKVLRIFVTMCDEEMMGRIGYVDVNPNNPSEILGYSKEPVLDIGKDGCFDDSGVLTASILKNKDKLFLYYSSCERKVKVPYTFFSGLAISNDDGESFKRFSNCPILERTQTETSVRSSPIVIFEDGIYKMWYTGGVKEEWKKNDDEKLMPIYCVKYLESKDGKNWGNKEGKLSVILKNDDEHGLAKPDLWKDDNKYKMIYSIRSFSKGYRLGYAESDDGISFVRKDDNVGIDVSDSGWDSEMICFSTRFTYKDKTYLFYCGNGYGLGGFGYAELLQE